MSPPQKKKKKKKNIAYMNYIKTGLITPVYVNSLSKYH